MPRVIHAYEELKDGKEIADLWHKANIKQADPKAKAKDKTKAKSKDGSTLSVPCSRDTHSYCSKSGPA